MEFFGFSLLGFDPKTGHKIVISVIVIAVALVTRLVLGRTARATLKDRTPRGWFWVRQAISLLVLLLTVVALTSIWFETSASLASFVGLFTAGVAFALQKVITSAAAYLLILRGKTFEVGDRIQMGGVRVEHPDLAPRVYTRLTEHYVELTLRYRTRDRDVREMTDRISREVLDALTCQRIPIGDARPPS